MMRYVGVLVGRKFCLLKKRLPGLGVSGSNVVEVLVTRWLPWNCSLLSKFFKIDLSDVLKTVVVVGVRNASGFVWVTLVAVVGDGNDSGVVECRRGSTGADAVEVVK